VETSLLLPPGSYTIGLVSLRISVVGLPENERIKNSITIGTIGYITGQIFVTGQTSVLVMAGCLTGHGRLHFLT